MPATSRIGLIGLDTSHVTIFTKILNDPNDPHHVPGGKVTVGHHPGGSNDFHLSYDRAPKFTAELKDSFGVKIVDSIEAVAENSDLIFIESVDGRVHREQFDRVLPFGKPIFIDKPMALSSADAKYMFDAAKTAGVPLMSASSLRYFDVAVEAIGDGKGIVGCDAFGPMGEEPTQPGLFWYGIHTVEMIVAAMGTGCAEVRAYRNENTDMLTLIWADGRVAFVHAVCAGAHRQIRAGLVVHLTDGMRIADAGQIAKAILCGISCKRLCVHCRRENRTFPRSRRWRLFALSKPPIKSRQTGQSVRINA